MILFALVDRESKVYIFLTSVEVVARIVMLGAILMVVVFED